MHYFNEEFLLCTACHHIVSSKEILSRYVYSHPVLEVLTCKRCCNRLSNTTASDSHKLCLWCGFPGKHTTCSKCSSNFCLKCLKNNFKEDTFKNITKKKNWTCFRCLPELLSEHRAKCAKVLKGMGNNQSVPNGRKRSNSESNVNPSNKFHRYERYEVRSSDDESTKDEYSQANKTVPSSADYSSTKEEIMEKANELSLLFVEVNELALEFRNKLKPQRCNLNVVQNAFTYQNKLLDDTLKVLKIWKEELTNTADKWERLFNISLVIPATENAKTREDDTGEEELDNSNDFHQNQSCNLEKKKKYKLSLKRSLESEYTDDGVAEDIIKESSLVPADQSMLSDEETLLEFGDDQETEILEVPNVPETEQNDIPVTPDILAPELGDEDSDHGSIFSEKTVILNFDELQPAEPLLDDIKVEVGSYEEDFTKEQIGSDKMILCETTGYFAAASCESDFSENTNNLCGNLTIGEDTCSETSFVFDIKGYGSKSPPHSESNDSGAFEKLDIDVGEESKTAKLDGDIKEDCQSHCATDIKSENEIVPSNDVPIDANDVHNNKVTNTLQHDDATNEQQKTEDKSETNNDEENLKHNNEVADTHEPIADEHKPTADEHGSIADPHEPIVDEHGPIADPHEPIVDEHGPIAIIHEHITDEHGPIADEHEPAVDEHGPNADIHEPIKDEHEPISDTHEPITDEHVPIADEHEPAVDEHGPNANIDEPIKDEHEPISDTHEPITDEHVPIADTHEPITDEYEPIAKEHEHTADEHEFTADVNEPTADIHEPIVGIDESITGNHQPVTVLNEQNTENNDSNNGEVANNPKLGVTSKDPCCSHDENTNEVAIENNDIGIKDITVKSGSEMDIEETPLIKHISDLEVEKDKIDFFDNLGLYSNIVEASTDYIKENNDASKKMKDILKLLKEDDSDLFDSDMDTSSASSLSDDEEEENKLKKVNTDQPGLVNTDFPTLPKEAIVLRKYDGGMALNEVAIDPEIDYPEYQIKRCYVVLERLEDILSKQSTASTSENSELREIERLTNLNNLDLKRKAVKSPKKNKAKKRKIIKESGIATSENEKDDSDSDTASLSSVHTPAMSDITCEGMLDALINFSGSTSDFGMETSGTESDCEDNNKKKKKRKKRAGSAESNKENQPDNQENDKSTPKELTAEELALAEKRKWRNDPLLRTKLDESGSETDDEIVEGENIVSEKTKMKMEALEERMKKRGTHKVTRKTSQSSGRKSENETDKDANLSSDTEDNTENNVVKPSIVINTDTDSDIEFISESKKRTPRKSPKSKTSICISSDEDIKQESDEDGDQSGVKKKGRKNIRAILSDETLEEATQRANLNEKKREGRVKQKRSEIDSIISQSEILSQEEGLILDVSEETKTPLIVVNSHLSKRLKDHQKSGVRFMWENCYEGVKQLQKDPGSGCILAHCMGLGKSFQVVSLVHTLFAYPVTKTKHVLVVCPLSIVLNWKKEFKKGLSGVNDDVKINIFCFSARHTPRKARLFTVDKWRQETGVLVMGYEAYHTLTNLKGIISDKRNENVIKALVDPGPDLVVLDEGHLLKNGKNTRTKALMKVKTKRRIILTGTPMQNNLKEYYHMLQFVKPNLLGSYTEYTNRFVNPIMNGQFHDSTEDDCRRMKNRSHVLNKLTKASVQRYEAAELEPYLPGKFDCVLFIQPHIVQAQLYEKLLEVLRTESGAIRGNIINNFHQFHMVWTHPCLLHLSQEQRKSKKKRKEVDVVNLDPEINDDSPDDMSLDGWWHGACPEDAKTNVEYGPKFKIMLSIIDECEKIGDKVLIFSSSIVELDAIEYFLQQHATPTSQWKPKEDYYRMDGTVVPDARLQLCDSFNDENNTRARVFLISNRVGGLGLNLIAANRVILMDVNWNPAYDMQSVFRIYRFGQKKPCYIYRLVTMGTMEEVVYQRQINKLAIAGRVVDEMQISRHYKSDDLQNIYNLVYDISQERPSLAIPPDVVLATVLQNYEEIFQYHEHQSLLENKPEEELDENEMKLAWDEFNKENENRHNRQLEEQKRRLMALRPGPSTVNAFLPGYMARAPGPPNMVVYRNNSNPNLPMQLTTQNSTTSATKTGAAQAEHPIEVIMVDDNNRQAFNAEEITEFRKNQTVAQTGNPTELSKQFFDYIKQFSHEAETATVTTKLAAPQPATVARKLATSQPATVARKLAAPQPATVTRKLAAPQPATVTRKLAAPQPATVARKLATPQPGGVNQANVSHTVSTTQAQSKETIVMPQILNTFTQSQIPVANLGYVLPKNIGAFSRKQKFKKNYVATKVTPLQKNMIQKTKAGSSYTVLQPSTSGTNSKVGTNRPNNIQIVRKTLFVNTAAEDATNSNAPVISSKAQAVNMQTDPRLSSNSSNAARLSKNVGNFNQPIDILNVMKEIRTITTDALPSLKTKTKTSTYNGSINDMIDDIIDVDSFSNQIRDKHEELIKSLNKNFNVTLSVRDKQNARNNLGLSKTNVNGAGNEISISAIPQNNNTQSNSNDVIEID